MKTNHQYQLQYRTWKEIEAIYSTDPVVIIPLGSMEVQGPHSLTGDYLVAEDVAVEICEKTGAYTIPVVPFGISEYFRSFPGTFTVRPLTFYNWVHDAVVCLAEHGVTKILFLNGHGGNEPVLEFVARDIRREYGLILGRVSIWKTMPPSKKKELYGENGSRTGHGGGMVDAVVRYLYPDCVKEELAGEDDWKHTWEAFEQVSINKTKILGVDAGLYLDLKDVSDRGSIGDPLASNADQGKAFYERMIDCGVDFVKRMQKSDMRIKLG